MSRPVYIVIYRSPIFAAHWAMWIPSYENGTAKDVGRLIQVEGSPSSGFTLEIWRNYDLSLTSRPKSVEFLCWVDSDKVVEVSGDCTNDTTPADVIDQWAVSVVAPGPSLRPASASGSRSRVELKNCQTWLRDLVVALVADGVFPNEALVNLDKAPKN